MEPSVTRHTSVPSMGRFFFALLHMFSDSSMRMSHMTHTTHMTHMTHMTFDFDV